MKSKPKPVLSQEEMNEREVKELTRQLIQLRRDKKTYLQKIEGKDRKIKERLEEICGDDPGEFYGCIKRSNEYYSLWLKKGPLPENLPDSIGVSCYKIWMPISKKRLEEIQKQKEEIQ